MPLPLTVSLFSKIQIGFTFLVPSHPGSFGQSAVKRVCVCVLSQYMAAAAGFLFVARTTSRMMMRCWEPPFKRRSWVSRQSTSHTPIAAAALSCLSPLQHQQIAIIRVLQSLKMSWENENILYWKKIRPVEVLKLYWTWKSSDFWSTWSWKINSASTLVVMHLILVWHHSHAD